MKKNYVVKIQKLSKYHGAKPSDTFTSNEIHEEEYNHEYDDYGKALETYIKHCKESAGQLAMSIAFTQNYIISLLDWEGTNTNKNQADKRKVLFQLNMSNL